MARPSKYESVEERRAADAERKRLARARDVDPDLPEVQVDEVVEPEPVRSRSIEVLLKLDPFAPLSEDEEQAVRAHFGYTESEKRTRAERQETADRIIRMVVAYPPG